MSEMVERLARAIAGVPTGFLDERWYRKARDGIAAMREPTEAMLDNAFEYIGFSGESLKNKKREIADDWRAMIDQALEE
jgi:hypothetical protein